mgnify:CR=1 FL=1
MSSHTKLSPSKRHQWRLCPGSVREQAKYPDERSGPAAIDGTHSHTLLEHCIKNGFMDASVFVGKELKDHDGSFIVDEGRAARVQIALNYIFDQTMEVVKKGYVNLKVLTEQRVDPEYLINRTDMGGTVDVQIIGGDTLELIDYKDGMGVVDAKGNAQLEQYALGVLAGYKLPINGAFPFSKVKMTIIQPKLAMKGMPAITSHTVTVREITDMIGTMVIEAQRTDDPNAPLVPGESQCKFCKAKGSCAALAGNVMKEIGVMFQPVQQVEMSVQTANKDPNTMSDQQIREIMEAAPLMRQLLDGVEKEAQRRLEAGQSIPGLKLVNGRGSRAWSLPEDQIAEKLLKMGVPKSEVWETKLVSPAKAEKLAWEKTKAGEKVKVQLTERQLKTLEQEYVTKLAGKLTVVPESDGRPAVITNAAPMFSAIEAPAAETLPSWLL